MLYNTLSGTTSVPASLNPRGKNNWRLLLVMFLIMGVGLAIDFQDVKKYYQELETLGVTVSGQILDEADRQYAASPIKITFMTLEGKEVTFPQNKTSRSFRMRHYEEEVKLSQPKVSVRYLPGRPRIQPLLLDNFLDQNSQSAEGMIHTGYGIVVAVLAVAYFLRSKWL